MPQQDFMTMTPGSAVADSLQDILTRRGVDKQQAFINQLNQKKFEQDEAYKNMQAESLAQNRAAQAQERLSNAANDTWQRQGGNPYTGDQEGDFFKFLQGHGFLSPDEAAPDALPDAPKKYHWAQTDTSQKRLDQQNDIKGEQTAIDQLLPGITDAKTKEALTIARNAPGGAPSVLSALVNRLMTPANPNEELVPGYKFNKISGKPEPLMGQDGKPMMVPRSRQFLDWGEQPSGASAVGSIAPVVGPNGAITGFYGTRPGPSQHPVNLFNLDGTAKDTSPAAPPFYKNPPVQGGLIDKGAVTDFLNKSINQNSQDTDIKAARAKAISTIGDPSIRADVNELVAHQDAAGGALTEQQVRAAINAPPGVDANAYIENVISVLKQIKAL